MAICVQTASASMLLRGRKRGYCRSCMTQPVLEGKVGVVFGVANKRSIAWAIAQAWAAAGARLIFNYQGERLKENIEELTAAFGEKMPSFPCDVSSDGEIKTILEKEIGRAHV